MTAGRNHAEARLHRAIVQLLTFSAAPGVVYFHVANERRATAKEGAFLKSLGVLAGVADLNFILPPDGHAAFVEIKTPKGRLSPEQTAFLAAAEAAGARTAVVRSIDEAIDVLTRWGALKRTARAAA